MLRIETTVNDLSVFKSHRKVEHREGHTARERAWLKAHRQSDRPAEILRGCNWRYRAFLSSLDDPTPTSAIFGDSVSRPWAATRVKGIHFFDAAGQTPLRTW